VFDGVGSWLDEVAEARVNPPTATDERRRKVLREMEFIAIIRGFTVH